MFISKANHNDISLDTDEYISAHEHYFPTYRYEGESPDEVALVHAAAAHGCKLTARNSEYVTVALPGGLPLSLDAIHCSASIFADGNALLEQHPRR